MSIPRIAAYPMPTEWPASRVTWRPEPQRAALLVHDMQDYFLDFYDRSAAPLPTLLAHVAQLVAAARAAGVPVFYTAQPAEQPAADRALLNDLWGPGLTAHPERQALWAGLQPAAGEVVLTKWRYSAFQRSDLRDRLRQAGRDQLLICGVYAHIGCMITAAEACMQDVQPFLIGDALADFSPDEHAQALRWAAGRCGPVLGTAEACAALVPPAAAVTAEMTALAAAVEAAAAVAIGTSGLPTSLDALRAQVAHELDVAADELAPHDNLLDWGLDSVRVMTLAERWRQAGRELNFVQLATEPTLHAWWTLLAPASAAPSAAAEALPA